MKIRHITNAILAFAGVAALLAGCAPAKVAETDPYAGKNGSHLPFDYATWRQDRVVNELGQWAPVWRQKHESDMVVDYYELTTDKSVLCLYGDISLTSPMTVLKDGDTLHTSEIISVKYLDPVEVTVSDENGETKPVRNVLEAVQYYVCKVSVGDKTGYMPLSTNPYVTSDCKEAFTVQGVLKAGGKEWTVRNVDWEGYYVCNNAALRNLPFYDGDVDVCLYQKPDRASKVIRKIPGLSDSLNYAYMTVTAITEEEEECSYQMVHYGIYEREFEKIKHPDMTDEEIEKVLNDREKGILRPEDLTEVDEAEDGTLVVKEKPDESAAHKLAQERARVTVTEAYPWLKVRMKDDGAEGWIYGLYVDRDGLLFRTPEAIINHELDGNLY